MERSGQSGMLGQMAGAGAPRAPQPGRGTGNIPYAGGMMSGQFGKPTAQAPPQPQTPAPPAAQAPPPGGSPSPGGAPPAPMGGSPMGPGASPFLQPEYLFQVYAAIMQALTSTAESDWSVY